MGFCFLKDNFMGILSEAKTKIQEDEELKRMKREQQIARQKREEAIAKEALQTAYQLLVTELSECECTYEDNIIVVRKNGSTLFHVLTKAVHHYSDDPDMSFDFWQDEILIQSPQGLYIYSCPTYLPNWDDFKKALVSFFVRNPYLV